MDNREAVNWLINISADIGKVEHSDLWHYEQALTEIKDMLESAQLSQEDATIVAKSKRTFVELLAEYQHPDLCTYPEYKGKPYYSIKYIEDGECFIGFGTYKLEVLSRYLKEFFMHPIEAIPVSWIEARIKRFMTMDNAFGGLTANIMLVMLNEWKREQEGETE